MKIVHEENLDKLIELLANLEFNQNTSKLTCPHYSIFFNIQRRVITAEPKTTKNIIVDNIINPPIF